MRLYFILLVIFVIATFFFGDWKLGAGEVVLLIALFIYSRISGKRRQNEILEYIESVTFNVDAATKDTLLNMPLPMVIINMEDGKILWSNEGFLEITKDREHFFEVVITDVVPGFSQK